MNYTYQTLNNLPEPIPPNPRTIVKPGTDPSLVEGTQCSRTCQTRARVVIKRRIEGDMRGMSSTTSRFPCITEMSCMTGLQVPADTRKRNSTLGFRTDSDCEYSALPDKPANRRKTWQFEQKGTAEINSDSAGHVSDFPSGPGAARFAPLDTTNTTRCPATTNRLLELNLRPAQRGRQMAAILWLGAVENPGGFPPRPAQTTTKRLFQSNLRCVLNPTRNDRPFIDRLLRSCTDEEHAEKAPGGEVNNAT